MIGETVSHYRILSRLGRGGMGVVYVAEDTHLGRRVAIKFSSADPGNTQYRSRFLREARAASALDHPHIARVYDYGETSDGHPFIVMELVSGEDLARLLQRRGVSVLQALRIVEEAAEALGEAHRFGIVHRDIKPGNILVNSRGQVKVLDFGLAKQIVDPAAPTEASEATLTSETAAGVVLGTPSYMSPEQAREAPLSPASDLFSLGTVLYECLAGRPAFAGVNSVDILGAVLHVDPLPPSVSNPEIPPSLDAIVRKALAKDPAQRYQAASEMIADIQAARGNLAPAEGEETLVLSTSPSGAISQGAPPSRNFSTLSGTLRRSPSAAVVTGAILAAVLIFAVWRFWPEGSYHASPDALRWYQTGVTQLHDGTYYRASQALEQAAKDPGFTMAHARLAEAWHELDFTDKAKEEMLRAVPPGGRPRVTRAEQAYLQALQLTLTGDFAGAAVKYAGMIASTPEPAKADAYLDLGRAYERAENLKAAVDAYREATRLQSQNPAAWLRLAVLYSRQSNKPAADQASVEAERIYRTLGNLEGVTEVEYQQGVFANRAGRTDEARKLLEEALELSRHIGSRPEEIAVQLQLSATDCRLGRFAQAQEEATQALDLARANGLEGLTARGLVDLGNAFFLKGQLSESKQYFVQSLDYARRSHSEHNQARALFSVANVEIRQDDPAGGMRDMQQALGFFQRGGYQRETAQALIIIGRAQRQKGDYSGALQSFDGQLEAARKIADTSQIALAQQGSGSVLMALGRYPEALARLQSSFQSFHDAGDKLGETFARLNCVDADWRLGRYADAASLLEKKAEVSSLETEIFQTDYRAAMLLSQRQFAAAAAAARSALAAQGAGPETMARAKAILAVSLANSGSAREATVDIADAMQFAAKSGSLWVAAETGRDQAEVLLAAGQAPKALEAALREQHWFEQTGNHEGEWRCWLIAALSAKSADYAQKARQALAALQQQWDAESYNSYLSRPDIQFARTQLERLGK